MCGQNCSAHSDDEDDVEEEDEEEQYPSDEEDSEEDDGTCRSCLAITNLGQGPMRVLHCMRVLYCRHKWQFL